MIDQESLFKKFQLDNAAFKRSKRHWRELEAIYNDYLNIRESLPPHSGMIADLLVQNVDKVHSVRSRIKDPEHLIAKIVKKENTETINQTNYRQKITDLVGLRALHLFKDDWIYVHEFIKKEWKLREKPLANIRKGDSDDVIRRFKKLGCRIKFHPFGYRSVHYLVVSRLNKESQVAEIQVRTIFEEGWSEIDHKIRYPYNLDNEAINQFLVVFNRLAGSADEMGTFIKFLQVYFQSKDDENRQALREKSELISQLKERIDQMSMKNEEKTIIKNGLEDLDKLSSQHTSIREALQGFSQESIMTGNIEMLRDAFFGTIEKKSAE